MDMLWIGLIVLWFGMAVLGILSWQKSQRLKQFENALGKQQAPKKIDREVDYHKRLKQTANDLSQENKVTLRDRLAAANLDWTPMRFRTIIGALTVFMIGLFWLIGMSPAIVVTLGPALGFGLPYMVVGFIAKRRLKAFNKDFAEALDSIARSLRAGLPVSEAFNIIGKEFTGPLAEEFGRTIDEQKLGSSLSESMQRMAKRVSTQEVGMLAIAIKIQTKTGGSLADTLHNLAGVIRGRQQLKRKIKAVSAEARMSAVIMGALPLFVMGALGAINPDYVRLLFEVKLGQFLLAGCGIWMSMGIFVMWRMVNFKV